MERVALSWAPKRAEQGPYTGWGERAVGLLDGRTCTPELFIKYQNVLVTPAQRVPVQSCSRH